MITTSSPYIVNIKRLPDDSLSLREHKLLKIYPMSLEVFRNMHHINVDTTYGLNAFCEHVFMFFHGLIITATPSQKIQWNKHTQWHTLYEECGSEEILRSWYQGEKSGPCTKHTYQDNIPTLLWIFMSKQISILHQLIDKMWHKSHNSKNMHFSFHTTAAMKHSYTIPTRKKELYISSLPSAPAIYYEQPRVSFFSHIMADRFNKVGKCCGILVLLFCLLIEVLPCLIHLNDGRNILDKLL